jgi:RimJ/RimL family protein N-acetyltransferase
MNAAVRNGTDAFQGISGRLRDGTLVHLRTACPADRERVLEFLDHTSRDSLALRYLRTVGPETAASEMLEPSAPHRRLSLLDMDLPDPGTVLGHGEYICMDSEPTRAEVAFLVADHHQGEGAATMLLIALARHARQEGVEFFDAVVLPENSQMIDVFVGAGFPCSVALRDGLEQVSLDIGQEPMTGIVPYAAAGQRDRLQA